MLKTNEQILSDYMEDTNQPEHFRDIIENSIWWKLYILGYRLRDLLLAIVTSLFRIRRCSPERYMAEYIASTKPYSIKEIEEITSEIHVLTGRPKLFLYNAIYNTMDYAEKRNISLHDAAIKLYSMGGLKN